jgi:DNA-binding beta-propeller fold protein YncE
VAIGANGDIFVSDGHGGNVSHNARVFKFAKDGRFIKTWGHEGPAPGDFDDPHDIAIGGSLGRIYVADRRNSRIQVFDQDGNFITAWPQFGQPSSVFVGPDDKIYAGVALRDESVRRNASSQVQPGDLATVGAGTSASGIAADAMGNVYAADVGAHKVRKYILPR